MEEIVKNFNLIYPVILAEHKMKITVVAKKLGYTSTTQLSNTLSGKAVISTKAIMCMVKNLNINPTFLFTGSGSMFLDRPIVEIKPKMQFEYTYTSTAM